MDTSRRHFLQSTAAAGLMAAQKVSANDRIRIALIGAGGIRGSQSDQRRSRRTSKAAEYSRKKAKQ